MTPLKSRWKMVFERELVVTAKLFSIKVMCHRGEFKKKNLHEPLQQKNSNGLLHPLKKFTTNSGHISLQVQNKENPSLD